jgi:hypothetical protein
MAITQAERYAQDVYSSLRLYAVWPPGLSMEIGAYGVLQGKWFRHIGNIRDKFDIQFSVREGKVPVQLDFKSTGTSLSTIEATLSADDGPAVKSGEIRTKLSFKTAWSSYCRVRDATYNMLLNQDAVNAKIMEAFERGLWQGGFAYVHGVFKAKSTTIISSSSDGAEIDLSGRAMAGQALDLADAQAGITVKSQQGISNQIVASAGLTPFMCLSGMRPKNRILALFGLSPRRIETFFTAEEEGAAMVGSHNKVLILEPDISIATANELEIDPREAYHVVEI